MPKKFKKRKKVKRKVAKKTFKKLRTQKLPKTPPTKISLLDKKSFLKGKIKKIKIRVIGIGGGGGSIVSEISQRISPLGKGKISFVAANTDSKALKKMSFDVLRFPFGQDLTFGMGTGMNPHLGRSAAQKEKEKIQKILEGQDLIIFVASLGGGIGSGATPIFAKICQDLGLLTFGFFTLPFKFEGEKKMEIAKNSLKKLKPYLNALTIVPNEKIFQVIDKKTSLNNALSVINKILSKSLEGLLEIIYQPGLINIDFADFKTILAGSSLTPPSFGDIAYLNTAEMEGPNKIQEATKELISSPLYPYTISGAKGILFNISGPPNLKLSEVNEISQAIWQQTQGQAKIIFGVSENKQLKDKLKITLLAVGCKTNFSSQKQIIKKKIKKQKIKSPKEDNFSQKKTESELSKEKRKSRKIPIANQTNLEKAKQKVRRNALEIKKAIQEEEEKILAKEKFWEIPAFLRKQR